MLIGNQKANSGAGISQSERPQAGPVKSTEGVGGIQRDKRGEVTVVSKNGLLLMACLFAMGGAWAFARSQDNKAAPQQTDPVQQALAQGVDHIDASDATPAPALDRRDTR